MKPKSNQKHIFYAAGIFVAAHTALILLLANYHPIASNAGDVKMSICILSVAASIALWIQSFALTILLRKSVTDVILTKVATRQLPSWILTGICILSLMYVLDEGVTKITRHIPIVLAVCICDHWLCCLANRFLEDRERFIEWNEDRNIRRIEKRLIAGVCILLVKPCVMIFSSIRLIYVPIELLSLSLLIANIIQIRHIQKENGSKNQKDCLEDQMLIHIGLLVGVSFAVLRWIIELLTY